MVSFDNPQNPWKFWPWKYLGYTVGLLQFCAAAHVSLICNSITTDIIKSKLETAKIMGADMIVDGTQQNLKEVGKYRPLRVTIFPHSDTPITDFADYPISWYFNSNIGRYQ